MISAVLRRSALEGSRRRGRCRVVGAQLIEPDGQHAEHLADVIVQLAPDAAALLLLGMDQPAGELFELLFAPLCVVTSR